jgi:hypothetical protein
LAKDFERDVREEKHLRAGVTATVNFLTVDARGSTRIETGKD